MFHIALFIHIAGVLGLFAGWGMLTMALVGLRQATTTDHAKMALVATSKIGLISGLSSGLILLSGLYMMGMAVAHQRPFGWMVVALVAFMTLGALASGAGKKTEQLRHELGKTNGKLPDALREKAHDQRALVPIAYSVWLAVGLLALMVFEPTTITAIVVMIVALALGYVTSLRFAPARRASQSVK